MNAKECFKCHKIKLLSEFYKHLYPFKEANMLKYFQKLFSKNVRKPATCGHIITLSGAVMIHSADGNVILAPGFVREILPQLTHAANEAAEHLST